MNPAYIPAPIPVDEEERLQSLHTLNILDTPPEERFDRITKIATVLFNVPISTVTLVDSRREWYKSCQGLPVHEGERAISFCGHAVLSDEPLIIPDAKADPRFAGNPMVVSPPFIRFYAGIPLKSADGKRVGAFCIKDHESREFSTEKIELLKAFSAWAELELNSRELSLSLEARKKAEERIVELNETLKILNKTLRHDILNDLTVVKGNIKLFLDGQVNAGDLQDITVAAERSIGLITEMKELESAVSSGAPLKEYEIKEVVEAAAKLFPDIPIVIAGEGKALADEALTSIIDNLIRNAITHGKTEKIDIVIKEQDNFLDLSVIDYGKGIPDEVKGKLFTEGFKYGETGHTGMGLYIVRKTVERYGGKVRVENNTPKGSIFIVSLPKSQAPISVATSSPHN
jgi:signal transduction histidine kinase